MNKLDKTKLVKAIAREKIGPMPRPQVVPNKRKKKPKYNKLDEY